MTEALSIGQKGRQSVVYNRAYATTVFPTPAEQLNQSGTWNNKYMMHTVSWTPKDSRGSLQPKLEGF